MAKANDYNWRRFEIITDDNEQEETVVELLESKKLSREDLILILKTIRLREGTNLKLDAGQSDKLYDDSEVANKVTGRKKYHKKSSSEVESDKLYDDTELANKITGRRRYHKY